VWKVYFNLTESSKLEANSEISGIKLGVRRGSTQLTAENIDASDEAEAQQKALTAANQFLDGLWKYYAYLDIDVSSRHIESPTGQKRGYISIQGDVLLTSQPTGVKKNSSGNIIQVHDPTKLGRIDVKPSEAAGYYRHAHLTNDTFNKFRDLYLVAENVASKIQAVKRLSQRDVKRLSESGHSFEEGLFKLALDACFSSNPHSLGQIARNLPGFDEAKDTIPQVAKILYNGYRCQLNHSKALEDKKIPFNPEDEKEVRAALPLMEFVAKSLLRYEDNSLL